MFDRLTALGFTVFLFLLPLFFLPIPNSPVDSDKQALLVFFAVFFLIVRLLKITFEKKVSFIRSTLDLPVLIISVIPLVSVFLFAPNKVSSLVNPLSAGTLVATAVLFFTISQLSEKNGPTGRHLHEYLEPLFISGALLSLITILSSVKVFTNITPVGNQLSNFTFMLPLWILIIISMIYAAKSVKNFKITGKSNLISLISLVFITLGLGLSSFHLLTDQKPLLLPFPAGWAIMMQMWRDFTVFLFGVGASNFSYAFTAGKPAMLNLSPFWNIITTSSTSFFLTLATETGAITAIAFLFIALRALNTFGHPKHNASSNPYLISFIITLILLFILPGNIVLFICSIILLAFACPKLETKNYTLPKGVTYLSVLVILGSLYIVYAYGKTYVADIYYRKSLNTLSQKDPKVDDAVKFNQTAISFNPNSDIYYNLASVIDLGVARNLVQSLQKDNNTKGASDSAKQQTIAKLAQQAIDAARQSTQLNPLSSQNWGQLSNAYQFEIGSVKDAEKYAFDALDKQMQLDPTYPQPKLTAGNLFMAFGQKDQAKNFYMQAVNLKPDWNIAHYSLAQVYEQDKDYQNAYNEVQRTIDLTAQDSDDYKKLQQELDKLKTLLPKEGTPSANTNDATALGTVAAPSPSKQPVNSPKKAPMVSSPAGTSNTTENTQGQVYQQVPLSPPAAANSTK